MAKFDKYFPYTYNCTMVIRGFGKTIYIVACFALGADALAGEDAGSGGSGFTCKILYDEQNAKGACVAHATANIPGPYSVYKKTCENTAKVLVESAAKICIFERELSQVQQPEALPDNLAGKDTEFYSSAFRQRSKLRANVHLKIDAIAKEAARLDKFIEINTNAIDRFQIIPERLFPAKQNLVNEQKQVLEDTKKVKTALIQQAASIKNFLVPIEANMQKLSSYYAGVGDAGGELQAGHTKAEPPRADASPAQPATAGGDGHAKDSRPAENIAGDPHGVPAAGPHLDGADDHANGDDHHAEGGHGHEKTLGGADTRIADREAEILAKKGISSVANTETAAALRAAGNSTTLKLGTAAIAAAEGVSESGALADMARAPSAIAEPTPEPSPHAQAPKGSVAGDLARGAALAMPVGCAVGVATGEGCTLGASQGLGYTVVKEGVERFAAPTVERAAVSYFGSAAVGEAAVLAGASGLAGCVVGGGAAIYEGAGAVQAGTSCAGGAALSYGTEVLVSNKAAIARLAAAPATGYAAAVGGAAAILFTPGNIGQAEGVRASFDGEYNYTYNKLGGTSYLPNCGDNPDCMRKVGFLLSQSR